MNGIPTTCLARTLLDLASVLPPYLLARTFAAAETERITDGLSVPELIARHPHRKGIRELRRILAQDVHYTRSDLEAHFVEFARKHRLPPYRTNYSVLGRECDAVWPEQRLIVELDTRSTHDTHAAFELDRERDRILQAAGWRVVRVTGRQLRHHAKALAADLRRLLR